MSAGPSNMRNFTENSYNLTTSPQSWCVKPGSLYTNPAANFNYFNKKCADPYTSYSYWYRRFPNQTTYLNCYYLPYKDVELKNKWGYLKSQGNCQVPYVNYRYNSSDGKFKYFDTRINPLSAPIARGVRIY